MLQWLSYAARPVSVQEAAEVLAIEIGDCPHYNHDRKLFNPLDILLLCSTLVIRIHRQPWIFPKFMSTTARTTSIILTTPGSFGLPISLSKTIFSPTESSQARPPSSRLTGNLQIALWHRHALTIFCILNLRLATVTCQYFESESMSSRFTITRFISGPTSYLFRWHVRQEDLATATAILSSERVWNWW